MAKRTVTLGNAPVGGEVDTAEFEPVQLPGENSSATVASDISAAAPQTSAPQPADDEEGSRTVGSNQLTFSEASPSGGATIDATRIAQTLDSVDLPDTPVPAPPRETVDVSQLDRTQDSDSIDFGPIASVPIAPLPGEPRTTVDSGRVAQTIDSVDLPLADRPRAAHATVDEHRLAQTLDSDSVNIAAGWSFPRANVVDETGQSTPTMDETALPRPVASDSSIVDGGVSQTLDSIDRVPTEPVVGGGTVQDRRASATIDSSSVDRLPLAGAIPGEPPVVEQAVAQPAGSVPAVGGSGTVHEDLRGRTVVDDAVPPVKSGTVADRNVQATFDSQEIVASGFPRPGTVPDREQQATYDSQEVSSHEAKQVDQMWRGANVEKASPRMTIKGRDDKRPTNKTSLVIQRRQFRDLKSEDFATLGDADYDLLKVLGQGGMGVVYSARQASIDRTVALKMLKPDMAKDEAQRSKFLAEAVITGDLDHPNIVPIYDLGKNLQGALFYAMKRVEGTPWDREIQKKSLVENLDILLKVADAVAFAHSRNVVHRDLKPENVMLGNFGEVLVMDWGLALPFAKFEKSRSIQPSFSMGGTPAYMAPEMATGPFDRIGPTSDVYLLGAILYEIVTGKPPHTGKDVMKCLFAAAKNEIQPAEKTGELINIAYKAMATRQKDRYQTVQEFQAAIREYEAHSASIAMAARAQEALEEAQKTGSYDTFARAVFESQEAVTLWSGNERAQRGVSRAKLAYANCALQKEDLDLAASLLDTTDPAHAELLVQVAEAKREREEKQRRLQANRRLIRNLVAAFIVAVTAGLIAVSYQTVQVSQQRDLAQASEREAKKQEAAAQVERDAATQARLQEAEQRKKADENARVAEAERDAATQARVKEAEQRKIAEAEAYVALIGLAAAKIEENAFDYARQLLDECDPKQRNWEWGRLMYLCQQGIRSVSTGSPIDAVAFSSSGDRFVTGGWNGLAQVFNTADGSVVSRAAHAGSNVYAVAYSPAAPEFATGSNDPQGYLRIWNADSGEFVRTLIGHRDGVLSVTYSHDGRLLLSSSFDNTAILWDAATGQLLRRFTGHTWWVWAAAFSPDDKQIVTASQDGTALVWSVDTAVRSAPFMGHRGPVYAAAFSPDGREIVTGGYDKRVLLWRPSELKEFDYAGLVRNDDKVEPPAFRALDGHLGAVRSVAFSADGKLILSGGHDNAVKVWSVESGSLVKTLRGHGSWVRSCAFSPDGKRALSGSHDQFARLWDVSGYEEARVLQGRWLRGHRDAVMAVAFAPSGDQAVTASRDRTARIWNARTGQFVRELDEGHWFLASTAAFYPDAKRLATAAGDNTTRVWDVVTGTQLRQLEGTGLAAAVAVSHHGRWLLTGGGKLPRDEKLQGPNTWIAQLWDANSQKRVHQLPGHNSQVTAVAFSPDDQYCFTGDNDGRGVLWRCDSGEPVCRLSWHTSKIAAARFLADGSRLITASDDKTVAQWDTSRLAVAPDSVVPLQKLILKHDESVLSLDVVSDKRLAITSTVVGRNAEGHETGSQVQLWDLDRAVVVRTLAVGRTDVNSVAFTRDGQRALTAHPQDNCVRLWDVHSGEELRSAAAMRPGAQGSPYLDLQERGTSVWSAIFVPGADQLVTVGENEARLWDLRAEADDRRELMRFSPNQAVVSVGYSPDGKYLVTGSRDHSARIWNVETGRDERKLVGHTGNVNSATFSPDGKLVLTTSDDGTARIWNAATGEMVGGPFTGHRAAVRFGVFSPDGQGALTTSDDKTARLWNAGTGALVHEFKGHAWGVLCASFSADGRQIITGGDDNSAWIWDSATGQPLQELSGHTAAVTSVAFSPDGERVLTASADFTAKLWAVTTGIDDVTGTAKQEWKEILSLKGHTQELTSVAFSQDGRSALTGSQDGTAVIWLTTDWKQPPAVASTAAPTR